MMALQYMALLAADAHMWRAALVCLTCLTELVYVLGLLDVLGLLGEFEL